MVNWDKWLIELLPMRKRTISMFALCRVLASPIFDLHHRYEAWLAKMRVKSGCMPLACMLEKMVYDELGINIVIKEGDGKPVDFLIKTSFNDINKERQLFALIERYKMAGKSYAYNNEKISYQNLWCGYVCEQASVSSQWTRYICEQGKKINKILVRYESECIHIKPEFPVASDIIIEAHNDDSGVFVDASFRRGDNTESVFPWAYENGAPPSRFVIEPVEDEIYKYIIEWQQ